MTHASSVPTVRMQMQRPQHVQILSFQVASPDMIFTIHTTVVFVVRFVGSYTENLVFNLADVFARRTVAVNSAWTLAAEDLQVDRTIMNPQHVTSDILI